LDGRQSDIPVLLHEKDTYNTPLPKPSRRDTFIGDIRFYIYTNPRAFYIDVAKLMEMYPAVKLYVTAVFRVVACVTKFVQRLLFKTQGEKKLRGNHVAEREKLRYITPAHDGLVIPRRIVIGITSRLRGDKAKREHLLIRLCDTMRLDAFHFEIIGRGWEEVIPRLEAAGARVRYYPGTDDGIEDYRINLERVPLFDYYLYLGFDEGSMGFLDALAAGVPTIVTPQGFHLDINGGVTHAFSNIAELCNIFEELVWKRQCLIDNIGRYPEFNHYLGKGA